MERKFDRWLKKRFTHAQCTLKFSRKGRECPKCGMTLEMRTVTADADGEENAELRDMTRRFWIGAALALPVFVLAMSHLIPALARQSWVVSNASHWVQFALTSPVVLWAGWPFFDRGWRSVLNRHLNMFTLISMGVGAAFVSSAVGMLAPGLFPHIMRHDGNRSRSDIGFGTADPPLGAQQYPSTF